MDKVKYKLIDFELIIISVALIILSLNRNSERFGITDLGNDLLLFFVVFLVSQFVIFQYSNFLKITRIEITAIALAIVSLPSLVFSQSISSSFLYGFLQFAFIPIGLLFGQLVSVHITLNQNKDKLLLISLLPAIITSIIFITIHSQLNTDMRDFIFVILVFLPYVLFLNNKVLKILLAFLFFFVILLSAKRTAIVSGVVFLFFLIISQFNQSQKLSTRIKSILVIITIIAIAANFMLSEYSETTQVIIERFVNVQDDGGSGRDIIYGRVVDGIKNANLENIFWGHGYHAVTNILLGHPAHNDFLEIIYDNGIFALTLYVLLFCQLLLYCYKCRYIKKYYLLLMACIVNYLILAFLNCIITNPLFVFVTMTLIGLSIGNLRYTHLFSNERLS